MLGKYFKYVCFLMSTCLLGQHILNYEDLDEYFRQNLFERKYITETQFNDENSIGIYGFNKEISPQDPLKNGVYRAQARGSHKIPCYVILEYGKAKFLDIYTFEFMQQSIKEILNYSLENNYCNEITYTYLGDLISRYYFNIQYSYLRGDFICASAVETKTSAINRSALNDLILDRISSIYGKNKNEIEIDDVYISKIDFCSEMTEDEKLDVWVYSYSHYDTGGLTDFYFILMENDIQFLTIENDATFIKTVQEIVRFGHENWICYTTTLWIIERIFNDYYKGSCLDLLADELP